MLVSIIMPRSCWKESKNYQPPQPVRAFLPIRIRTQVGLTQQEPAGEDSSQRMVPATQYHSQIGAACFDVDLFQRCCAPGGNSLVRAGIFFLRSTYEYESCTIFFLFFGEFVVCVFRDSGKASRGGKINGDG